MHAHRIEIFDGTDDHAVIHPVAHHFHLEFFPAHQRFLDQHFVDGRKIKAASDDHIELFAVVSDAAASAAQSERRSDNERECSDVSDDSIDVRQGTRHPGSRHLEPYA